MRLGKSLILMLILLVPFASAQAGDVTGDLMVDLDDLLYMTTNLGTADPAADINSDGNVNIFDMVVVARNYGNDYSSSCTCSDFACQANSTGLVCDGCNYVSAPIEICDGIDNNCDGTTDEGCNCNCMGYACEGAGTGWACNGCNWVQVNNMVEICDGIDNNCDGNIDEGCSQNCTCFDNSCQVNNTGLVCDGCDYVTAPSEICSDTADNDCDGTIDCSDSDCSSDPACQSNPVCGDNNCDAGEMCSTCPADCGTCSNSTIPSIPVPAGLSLDASADFSVLPPPGWWSEPSGSNPGAVIILDPTDLPLGFTGVGNMHYSTGSPPGGGTPGSVGVGGLSGRDMFVRVLAWWGPNWENHPTGTNKAFYAETSFYNDGVPWIINRYTGNVYGNSVPVLEFKWQGAISTEPNTQQIGFPWNFGPNLAGDASLNTGTWYLIWAHFKSNTGQGDPDVNGGETVNQDGELHAWVSRYDSINGWSTPAKTHEYLNFSVMDQSFQFNRFKWQPTWGGRDGTIQGNFDMRVADMQVYTN